VTTGPARALLQRLGQFLDGFSACFSRQPQRDEASQYLDGLFNDSERKSMQAMHGRLTSLESALHRIAAALIRSDADFALIGGLAVSVRTEPRFTRDADFAVAVASDGEAEALIRRLRARGYEVAAVVEQEAVERLATVRLTVVDDVEGPVIDLLFASSGIEREVVAAAESLELLCNGLCSGPICAVARAGRGRIPGVMSTTGPSCGLSSYGRTGRTLDSSVFISDADAALSAFSHQPPALSCQPSANTPRAATAHGFSTAHSK
jgi:hypothetical protein